MIPQTMTAIAITRAGGPEVLVPETRPVPVPGDRQVLVRVAAAGVNRHDCGQRARGEAPAGATDIPGLEMAGEVVAVGAVVRAWKPGDRVCALVNGGAYAEYCIAEEALTFRVPDGFDFVRAAALPEGLFTAWHSIYTQAGLEPGETLLVHGGTSGVGAMAIQMARAFGSPVLATAGTDAKCEQCRRQGVVRAINYRTEDFVAVAREVTGGRGVDVIFDLVGGSYGERNLEALAMDGRVAHIASQADPVMKVPLRLLMGKRLRVMGSAMRPLPLERKTVIANLLRQRVWPLLGSAIDPLIDSTIPLARACDAHARMESGVHAGKILLEV